MITGDNEIRNYLQDYHEGKIPYGLGIGIHGIDQFLRYKQGQFTMVNGHDNVGKTVWILWYFLCLATKHNKKFTIYSAENREGALMRQLIQFASGKYFKSLELKDVFTWHQKLASNFKFIDIKNLYTSTELFKIFQDSGSDACLIDPYTGLNRDFSHTANYQFLNESRHFCNSTGISLYVNTHPNTEAARAIHTKESCQQDESIIGYPKAPLKSQSEGGQPFANRPDDFITIHRYVGHPNFNHQTMVYTRKIKDVDTGGHVMAINDPVYFNFNKGLGFTCDEINPLNETYKKDTDFEPIKINSSFEEESETVNDLPF